VERVEMILNRQDTLKRLFDHGWVALAIMDPEENDRVMRYQPGGSWAPMSVDEQPAAGVLPEA